MERRNGRTSFLLVKMGWKAVSIVLWRDTPRERKLAYDLNYEIIMFVFVSQ